MKKINVMIVDDSLLDKVYIRKNLEADPQKRFHVLERASNGKQAIYNIQAHMGNIDVIIMDIHMPVMNGIEAIKKIMEDTPMPIIVISSLASPNAAETIQALEYGAYDFMFKPETKEQYEAAQMEMCEKLENGYRHFNKQNQPSGKSSPVRETTVPALPVPVFYQEEKVLQNLILIGSSAGGPRALKTMIKQMPRHIPAGVVVVQHMLEGPFIQSMVERMDQQVQVRVKIAEDGEVIRNGCVYISGSDVHIEVAQKGQHYVIVHNRQEPVMGYKPSVNVLFHSVAALHPDIPVFAVVATGMGADGAEGIRTLKKIGATTIAESEKTALIYGMPKKAKETGAIDFEEDLTNIIPLICSKL